jgi:hypothetical protein
MDTLKQTIKDQTTLIRQLGEALKTRNEEFLEAAHKYDAGFSCAVVDDVNDALTAYETWKAQQGEGG